MSKEEKVFLMTNLRDLIIQEGRSLFHSISDRADFCASVEHLCQDAEEGRWTSESLTLASTAGYASEQADEGEYERT